MLLYQIRPMATIKKLYLLCWPLLKSWDHTLIMLIETTNTSDRLYVLLYVTRHGQRKITCLLFIAFIKIVTWDRYVIIFDLARLITKDSYMFIVATRHISVRYPRCSTTKNNINLCLVDKLLMHHVIDPVSVLGV